MKKYALLIVVLLLNLGTNAQDDPGLPGGDPDVPIDGGVALLLIAGAAYGLKKIKGINQPEE
ncbi:MAG TPA: hypothetical protein VKB19_10075 [Pedobacter sp.]|nr:hypothetical protein [Pedobacter sp.]